MFKLFKKKPIITDEHQCRFNKRIGEYYIWHRTKCRNDFDTIIVYQRMKCSCGKTIDVTISKDTLLPSLYFGEYKHEQYIKALKKRGVYSEFEINLMIRVPKNVIPKR